MFGWLISLINPLGQLTKHLADAYAAKSNATLKSRSSLIAIRRLRSSVSDVHS